MGELDNIFITNEEAELLSKDSSAPFSDKVVSEFNKMQDRLGLYTCMGNNSTCVRNEDNHYGILKAEKNQLICPCGRYKQKKI